MTEFFKQGRFIKYLQTKTFIFSFLFVVILTQLIVFRRPIAINTFEYFTEQQNIQLSCLEFSINWQLNFKVQQACINSPQATVVVQNANWQPWAKQVNIQQVNIKHLQSPPPTEHKSETQGLGSKPIDLGFVNALPKLNIASLELDSYLLLQPLRFKVQTLTTNQMQLTGDLKAEINLSADAIGAELDWRLADVTKYLAPAQKLIELHGDLLNIKDLEQNPINTKFSFDGTRLRTQNQLQLTTRLYLAQCPIDMVTNGKLIAAVDITTLSLNLDLSKLNNYFSAADCQLVTSFLAEDALPKLSLNFAENITFANQQVILPAITIAVTGLANGKASASDNQKELPTLALTELTYTAAGKLTFKYLASIKQPIQSKIASAKMLDFQAEGQVLADLSAFNNQGPSQIINQTNPPTQASENSQPMALAISNDKQRLSISDLKLASVSVGKISSEFAFGPPKPNQTKFAQTEPNQLTLSGKIQSTNITADDINLAQAASQFSITTANVDVLQGVIDNQISNLSSPNFSLHSISNHLNFEIHQLDSMSFTGSSQINQLSTAGLDFQPITASHSGRGSLTKSTIASEHTVAVEQDFAVEFTQQQSLLRLDIAHQDLLVLQNLASQFDSALTITNGLITANLQANLSAGQQTFLAQGQANLHSVFLKYQDYLINNINYQTPLSFDSAGLQLARSNLHIDSINLGVEIQQLSTQVMASNSQLQLQNVTGKIFDGRFSLASLWLDGRDKQQFTVDFKGIDLAKVVALQKQPGLTITGSIDGAIPMVMDKQGISVKDGWMSSLSGGKLTIVDNPSFDSIKAQQPELALLENLEFSQLDTKVKFNPDGWVFFDFAMQGNNPDKNQSVNFNYSHEENIFSLLESIRLVQSVENTIEQKIIQGDKK